MTLIAARNVLQMVQLTLSTAPVEHAFEYTLTSFREEKVLDCCTILNLLNRLQFLETRKSFNIEFFQLDWKQKIKPKIKFISSSISRLESEVKKKTVSLELC